MRNKWLKIDTKINYKTRIHVDQRHLQLQTWLSQDLNFTIDSLEPASADASFRRYFRLISDGKSFIAMDAPPDKEPIQGFIDCDLALETLNVHSPKIFASNVEQGFILLEDLGNRTYLDELPGAPHALYSDAIDALLNLQLGHSDTIDFAPPLYSGAKLVEEMSLFPKWFINKHLGENISEASFAVWLHFQQILVSACLDQPQVWVHRDYHSRNLMITQQRSPGVIDFQDMVVGPIAYDLASLFKDCYIEWPRAQQIEWLEEYRQKAITQLDIAEFSLEQLVKWFDVTGLQRHLKVLGIFCRLNYRDGKTNYLDDLPLVAKYTLDALELYPEFETFKNHFERFIRAAL